MVPLFKGHSVRYVVCIDVPLHILTLGGYTYFDILIWFYQYTAAFVILTVKELYLASQINDVKVSIGTHATETNLVTTSQPLEFSQNLTSPNSRITGLFPHASFVQDVIGERGTPAFKR